MTEKAETIVKMNPRLDLPVELLEDRIGVKLNGDIAGYNRIISPRDLTKVKVMTFFRWDVFLALIRRVPLRCPGDDKIYPYEDAEIDVFAREPKGFYVGQTFAMKDKLISIMTGLEQGVLSSFVSRGISKMPPVQFYGEDAEGRNAMAIYIPPIAEVHNDKVVLIDGIHRSVICKGAGTTINAVHIANSAVRLPFDPLTWTDVQTTDKKPAVEDRYRNLRREYFRDLSAIGIDA